MVNITANSTDALFEYTGTWSREARTDPTYRIWKGGDSLQLRLDASEVYLFGCAPGNGSSITFEFSGSGVIVKGLGNKSNINAAYKVSVNGNASAAPGTSDLWEAYAPANQAITLYRNMRLGNESQSITLSEIQLAPDSSFCVLRANVSSVNRHEDTPSSPSPTADDSHNSVSKSLSSGKKVGIAVGVIIIVGIIVGGIILFYRRRIAHRATTWDPKKVKYCSKCGTAITDRYRMECVQAGSCVQDVDLHLKCQDWNEPKNHSHEVHKVLNRQ
ncbi:transmembrane protein [Rhizoctonia solani]|uniref:Transmembrane protein n=1 Tax=Rhizoctonia solani TaxID=456999 RepID=A0A8H8NUM0_9AGAM|nr:uncharacterized protein RhiXN_03406 [Rhizoctonia solani]QRW18482.1 transmembrane protein [Rhizoctonia solani]